MEKNIYELKTQYKLFFPINFIMMKVFYLKQESKTFGK